MRSIPTRSAVPIIVLLGLIGCSGTGEPFLDTDASGQEAPSLSRPDAGTPTLGGGGGDASVTVPGACQSQEFVATKTVEPDMLLIMDMSGSMQSGTPSKYEQTATAVTNVMQQLEAKKSPVHWGLMFFPTDNDCKVDPAPIVSIGPNKGAQIVNTIKSTPPGEGGTPMAAAVKAATNYYDSVKDGRSRYMLIATDGEPNCESSGTTNPGMPKTCKTDKDCDKGQTCQALPIVGGLCVDNSAVSSETVPAISAAAAKGIKTYVVGISLNGTSSILNSMAEAGGTARTGSTKYYPVGDQKALEQAMLSITSQVISCTFTLAQAPGSGQEIMVLVDGKEVARDTSHAGGWDVDQTSTSLTFYGSTCTSIQGAGSTVSVGFKCPPPK